MVNKGRIHREFRYFQDIFRNLVKLDDELRWEIREMVFLERRLQIDSTESRIIEFGLDFAEKSKFEVERNFRTLKSWFRMKIYEIEI